jgi:hypothetical protein
MRKAAALRRLPVRLDRVDLVIAVVGALVVMHFVFNDVLEFRTEIGSVADAGAGEIGLRFSWRYSADPSYRAGGSVLPRRSLLAQPTPSEVRCLALSVRSEGRP